MTTRDGMLRTGMISSKLSSLLPSDSVSSSSWLQSRTMTQKQVFGSSFYRLLIFSIENNFAGLEDVPIGAVLEFMQQDPQIRAQLLRYLQMTPRNVSKVLAEKLIRAAIEICNASIVTDLLETGFVNPNEIVCWDEADRYTAVERSAMLGSIEVTKALFLAGADIEKTVSNWPRGALSLAVGIPWRDSICDIKLVKTLLDYGAKVDVDTVRSAVEQKDTDLIEMLMSKISPLDHSAYFQTYFEKDPRVAIEPFIARLVRLGDSDVATKFIVLLVEACSQTSCGTCAHSNPRTFRDALTNAAKRGNSKLVAFLLNYTIDEGPSLAGAIHSGREDIIDLLLERVANVDSPACTIGEPRITTPLAEAIRADNTELIHELERRGALSQISEESRFKAAIFAASEVGNLITVQRFLQMAPHMNGNALTPALSVSIKEGHENVALTLLKAGAEVNDGVGYTEDGYGLPLHEALRQKNKTLVYKILDCDVDVCELWGKTDGQNSFVDAAIQWGDLSIIQDLIQMNAFSDDVSRSMAIVAAVKANNKSLVEFFVKEHAFSDDDIRKRAIVAAVEAKNKSLIEFFVKEHGVKLETSQKLGASPLAIAVNDNDVDMMQYLLDLGAEPACSQAFDQVVISKKAMDRKEVLAVLLRAFRAKYPLGKKGFGSVALQVALDQEDFEMVGMLLEAKFDVNTRFCTDRFEFGCDSISAFGSAIEYFGGLRLDIITRLISAGGDTKGVTSTISAKVDPINIRWRGSASKIVWSQQTALLQAIGTKSKALAELLINAGADFKIAARLRIKRTPLQYACEVGACEIVELLLQKGVDVNEAPALRGGGTSLQLCAIGGYCKIAEKLLSHGADINAAPSEWDGRTALEGAAEHGRMHMLLLLWDAADHKRFSPDQCTRAMELAKENGHIACSDLLWEFSSAGQDLIMSEPFDRWTSFG